MSIIVYTDQFVSCSDGPTNLNLSPIPINLSSLRPIFSLLMNMDKKKNLNSVAEATSNADISLKKVLSQFGKRPQQWSAHKVLSYIPTQECCGAGPNAALLVFLIWGTAVCFLQELCEAMAHAWLHAGTLKCCRTTITIRMAYVNKASFHQASSPRTVPTLARSVWRRSALQPRRRAAGAEMRQKTHVKMLGGPFLWQHGGHTASASQDGQETASRGTESDTRTSSTTHVFTSDVNTHCGNSVDARLPLAESRNCSSAF